MAKIAQMRVLETVRKGAVETVRVQSQEDGSILLAHYGDLTLLDVADRLGPDVLERGESNGRIYILTPDRPDLRELDKPVSPPEQPAAQAGEFTRMFQAVAPEPPRSEPAKPLTPGSSDLGLTGIFSAVSRVSAPPEPSSTESRPASPPPATSESEEQPQRARPLDGEFTRMFQQATLRAAPAPPPATAPAPATREEPGAFTRMFAAPVPQKEAPIQLPPKPGAVEDSGEFTRFFQSPLPASREPDWKALEAQPAPEPQRRPEGDFTRMFGKQEPAKTSSTGTAPSRDMNPTAPFSPSSKPSTGSDDFSRVFARPPSPTATPTPSAAAPALAPTPIAVPVQAKTPPIWALVVILAALLVAAGCAVYLFVLRPK